jgi:hypothetical protein
MYPEEWVKLAIKLAHEGKTIDEIQSVLSNKYQCKPPLRTTIENWIFKKS